MPNKSVGELILSVVTTPERASSLVGDLVESRASSLRFWVAIGSNVLHAITPRIVGAAIAGFFAQFILFIVPAVTIAYGLGHSVLTVNQWHWSAVLAFLGTQMLTGFWLPRFSRRQPLLICLLVGLIDCALGAFHNNNVSVNMAIWSVPLVSGTIFSTCSRSRAGRRSGQYA